MQPQSKANNRHFYFGDKESSINHESQSSLVMNDYSQRSRIHFNLDDNHNQLNKRQIKSILKLKKQVSLNSREQHNNSNNYEVSDYGGIRNSEPNHRTGRSSYISESENRYSVSLKNSRLSKDSLHKLNSRDKLVEDKTNYSYDSDSSSNKNDNKSEVDITEVAKWVLTKWGIVRKQL